MVVILRSGASDVATKDLARSPAPSLSFTLHRYREILRRLLDVEAPQDDGLGPGPSISVVYVSSRTLRKPRAR